MAVIPSEQQLYNKTDPVLFNPVQAKGEHHRKLHGTLILEDISWQQFSENRPKNSAGSLTYSEVSCHNGPVQYSSANIYVYLRGINQPWHYSLDNEGPYKLMFLFQLLCQVAHSWTMILIGGRIKRQLALLFNKKETTIPTNGNMHNIHVIVDSAMPSHGEARWKKCQDSGSYTYWKFCYFYFVHCGFFCINFDS